MTIVDAAGRSMLPARKTELTYLHAHLITPVFEGNTRRPIDEVRNALREGRAGHGRHRLVLKSIELAELVHLVSFL